MRVSAAPSERLSDILRHKLSEAIQNNTHEYPLFQLPLDLSSNSICNFWKLVQDYL